MKAEGIGDEWKDLSDEWVGELKYDGRRAQLVIDEDGDPHFFSSTLKDQDGKLPHVVNAIKKADIVARTIIDGEYVVFKDSMGFANPLTGELVEIPDFSWTAKIMGCKPGKSVERQRDWEMPVTFVAFDCMMLAGKSQCEIPWTGRHEITKMIVEKVNHPNLILSPVLPISDEVMELIHDAGGEGMMFKKKSGTYKVADRSWDVRKFKFVMDADVVVMGYTQGQNRLHTTIGAIKYGQFKNGVLTSRGQVRGITDELSFHILDERNPDNVVDNREKYMGTVMVITHMGVSGGDRHGLRHPNLKEWNRQDKLTSECEWDVI